MMLHVSAHSDSNNLVSLTVVSPFFPFTLSSPARVRRLLWARRPSASPQVLVGPAAGILLCRTGSSAAPAIAGRLVLDRGQMQETRGQEKPAPALERS